MTHPIRTVDLATVAAPSSYIGQRAVWTDFEGREHVGVLAPDPMGGPWPVVDFGDGTHGRNGSIITLVIEPDAPATLTSTTGTAPLTFTATEPGLVRVDLEDGSSQVYAVADLLAALGGAR